MARALALVCLVACVLSATAFRPLILLGGKAVASLHASSRQSCRIEALARLSMCERNGEPTKRTTGLFPIMKSLQAEFEEDPQMTMVKLFFFPFSPLFFPVPLTIGYKIYQFLTEQ